MTIKQLKEFIKNCNDDDYVTLCTCRDDNPISDYCDVGGAYKIIAFGDDLHQICLMPL